VGHFYIAADMAGKSVLDIGVCEHTAQRIASDGWKHKMICDHASEVLGVDIIEPLVSELNTKGFNVVGCDATSNVDLGMRFDVVHVGDVIEHVNNPVALLEFSARHLVDGGKIVVRTPNCHCFDYVRRQKINGTDVSNLEHMFYITPMHALEIGRRAGLALNRTLSLYPERFSLRGIYRACRHILNGRFSHSFAELFATPEQYTTIFVFEYSKQ
jgi:2-polyprenyl-3-methyl-5-hydroxy-6-metoxy-1,4-benzoquinol methylase